MAELLGERALPDSIQSRRRRLRNRVSDIRRPIRRRRESSVPGPDLIGRGEDAVNSARRRIVTRDSPIGSIMSRFRSDGPDTGETEEVPNGTDDTETDAESDSERRSNSLL